MNISRMGVAVEAKVGGHSGERIVLYIDHIGRLEGTITRAHKASFAVALQMTSSKADRLTETLAWVVSHQTDGIPDNRQHPRIKTDRRQVILTTSDGNQYPATLIDLSIRGAALKVDAAPPIGALLTIGRTAARVARHFDKGIAVEFESQLPAAAFEADAKL